MELKVEEDCSRQTSKMSELTRGEIWIRHGPRTFRIRSGEVIGNAIKN